MRWANKLPEDKQSTPPPPDPRAATLKWFSYAHLPQELQDVSAQFAVVASWMYSAIPQGPEATVAMRKLLEAKDAAVRGWIDGKKNPAGKVTAGPSTTTIREEPIAVAEEG